MFWAGLGSTLAISCWWTLDNNSGRVGYRGWLLEPERFVGQRVVLPLVRVTKTASQRNVVMKGTLPFQVTGDLGPVVVGEEVYIVGTFVGAGPVVLAEEVFHAPDRAGKKKLGVIGMLATLLLVVGFVQVQSPLQTHG